MNIMFCDIIGSFTGPSETRKEDLLKFKDLLEELGKSNGQNKIMFCFNSNNDLASLLQYVKEFLPYIKDSTIILGPQFADTIEWYNGSSSENKEPKINKMIKLIERNEIKNIFCVDDLNINQTINQRLLKKNFLKNQLYFLHLKKKV